jgi:RNA polymerase sigma-70 factor (ECF subfamily)
MSSEVAAYFSNALANAADVRESASPQRQSSAVQPETGFSARESSTAPEISAEILLVEVGKGSKEALGCLYRQVAPAIYNVAVRILKDDAEAEDLVQDVFLFLFRKASQFDPEKGSARSWMIQATYHRAFSRRSLLRARPHYQAGELHDDRMPSSQSSDVEQASIDGIMAQQLRMRFQDVLTPDQCRTLELHFFGGLSFREIAEQTGQTLENTRKQYYRGCQRLRGHFVQKETPK